jgi:hypothetical protein
VLNVRDSWLKNYRSVNYGGSWRTPRSASITPEIRRACHTFADFLLSVGVDYKLVIYTDYGYFYTNDLDTVQKLCSLGYVAIIRCKQAQVDRPRDSLRILTAQHSYRSYFRQRRISQENRTRLSSFLDNCTDIRLSDGLKRWISFSGHQNGSYTQDNFFIDHNDLSFLTMLGLVSPVGIRKTVTLIRE